MNLTINDIQFTYPSGVHALRGISLTIAAGEFEERADWGAAEYVNRHPCCVISVFVRVINHPAYGAST